MVRRTVRESLVLQMVTSTKEISKITKSTDLGQRSIISNIGIAP